MREKIVFSTPNQSLVFEIGDCDIYWRYWGPYIEENDLPTHSIHDIRPNASFSPNQDFPLSIAPMLGNGWFNSPSISIDRNGRDNQNAFTKVSKKQNENSLEFELEDEIANFKIIVNFEKKPNDVIEISSKLINLGADDLAINQFSSAALRLPEWVEDVTYYTGRHNCEFVARNQKLSDSIWLRENRRGLTSHDNFPGAIIHNNCGQNSGDVYGAVLAHSGNSTQRIEKLDGGEFVWILGELLATGEIILSSNGTFNAPKALISFSKNGANGIANNFYGAMRNIIHWPNGKMKPRPIHLNTWEGFYFNHKESELMELAKLAAQIGVERFVLDDGWFKGRNDDTSSLGDWVVDKEKYPDGLEKLANCVIENGMEFGLWVEPEMVNPDSDLFRNHPDWALGLKGREKIVSRNQLVLNLARQDVRDYLFDAIDALLKQLPISYLKWDHNRDLTQASDAGSRPLYSAQVRGAYELMSRLRIAHPNVEIEACAGGGGRIDPGILQYSHRFWTSDCIDALSRIEIQSGFLQFFPPEIMGAHIGEAPSHSTSRTQDIDFRAAVAMQGHFGLEFDLRKMGEGELSRVKSACDLYKSIRDKIHSGNVWRGETNDGIVFNAMGDLNEFILFVFRITPCMRRFSNPIRLDFLTDGNYEIAQIFPNIESETQNISAAWLKNFGLNVPLIKAEQAVIFKVTKNG